MLPIKHLLSPGKMQNRQFGWPEIASFVVIVLLTHLLQSLLTIPRMLLELVFMEFLWNATSSPDLILTTLSMVLDFVFALFIGRLAMSGGRFIVPGTKTSSVFLLVSVFALVFALFTAALPWDIPGVFIPPPRDMAPALPGWLIAYYFNSGPETRTRFTGRFIAALAALTCTVSIILELIPLHHPVHMSPLFLPHLESSAQSNSLVDSTFHKIPENELPAAPDCTDSPSNDAAFMQVIHKITAHGNLADILFIDRTLDTNLTLTYHDETPDGQPDSETYEAGAVLGTPMYVRLNINSSRARQLREDSLGSLVFGGENVFLGAAPNYSNTCFRIKTSDFVSTFGGRFVAADFPASNAAQEQNSPGIQGSMLNLSVDSNSLYVSTDNAFQRLVTQIVIEQSAPPPQAVHPLPAYCKTSTLTGNAFMQMLQTIITHGDLTDVAFIEKTLGTKFSANEGYNQRGIHDPQTIIYRANGIFGNPIQVHLIINSKTGQKKGFGIASISFDSQPFANPSANFIRDCLNIPVSAFYSYYGRDFDFPVPLINPVMPAQEPIKKQNPAQPGISDFTMERNGRLGQNIPGKNGTKLSLGFRFLSSLGNNVVENIPVDSVSAIQNP